MRQFKLISVFLSLAYLTPVCGQTPADQLLGRWDLVMQGASGEYPSWMEVRKSGHKSLVGDFVGQFGSARPISKITMTDRAFRFVIPPQWEQRDSDLVIEGVLAGDTLAGETTDEQGRPVKFKGRRAPDLKRVTEPKWGEPIELFNGEDLAGWKPLLPGVKNGWRVKDGLLYNEQPDQNIATTEDFMDFKLHAEFRYPQGQQ